MFMNIRDNRRLIFGLLLAIILLASFLRLYKLDQIPPSLSWDEAAVGYNAYTIANWGKDEWGRTFPLYFKSFEDDKHPVHIYLTAIPVKLFGLSEYTTRTSSALFGIFNVVLIFFLGRLLFKSNWVGLLAALFLTISPYNLHFSRFNHELNFVMFFFMLGLLLFFRGIFGKKNLLPLSFLSFGITLLSYHSAKIVTPPIILLLIVLFFKNLWRVKKEFLISLLVFGVFVGIIIANPTLLGTARAKQTAISLEEVKKTDAYKKTSNEFLARGEIVTRQYLSHYSLQYLFISGDKNPRLSSQGSGEFYKIDAVFLIVGVLALLWQRSKITLVLFSWALLAPIPASSVNEAPHASRAMFMVGSWHLIAAFGFYRIINFFKHPSWVVLTLFLGFSFLGWQFKEYTEYYYNEYGKRYAIEWQYGMKQAIEYTRKHNGYFQVYVTDVRSQPYIFFLYYLRESLPTFLDSVKYNDSSSRSYNLISGYENLHFGGNLRESKPDPGILYMVSPSEYDGLMYRNVFNIKETIHYPNGTDAFFLVSYP